MRSYSNPQRNYIFIPQLTLAEYTFSDTSLNWNGKERGKDILPLSQGRVLPSSPKSVLGILVLSFPSGLKSTVALNRDRNLSAKFFLDVLSLT